MNQTSSNDIIMILIIFYTYTPRIINKDIEIKVDGRLFQG